MTFTSSNYLRDLKSALTGDHTTPLVFICNFEVESQWAVNHIGVPAVPASSPTVVQRMEELGVLLAGPGDHIVLKRPLDSGYRDYLEDLGIGLPEVILPERTAPDRSTSEDLLDSPRALDLLGALGAHGARLIPMGTSAHEEKLAAAAQIPLAVPDTVTFERVNSKIYSRQVTAQLGLPCVPGWCCESVGQLREVLTQTEGNWARSPLVVKDAYGVSGKGLVVVDSVEKASRLLRMIERRATRTGDDRLAVVVEHWLPRHLDLNYQITIGSAGEVRLDFVKQALTDHGVHQGHLMPAELSEDQHAMVSVAAYDVGRRLFRDGFTGVAGIDAIVTSGGQIYPVLEINARFNMSTYQGRVAEHFQPPGHLALARHYPLSVAQPVGFAEVRRAAGAFLRPAQDGWMVITCFGTVNAGAGDAPSQGRLYTMLIAPDRRRLTALDQAVRSALSVLVQP